MAAEIRERLRVGVRGVLGLAEPETTRDPLWDAALVAWRLGEEQTEDSSTTHLGFRCAR
jgi:hypothetical protein